MANFKKNHARVAFKIKIGSQIGLYYRLNVLYVK